MHEAYSVIEKVKSLKKSPENLSVIAVQPLAAGLDRVLAVNDGEVVPCIGAPEDFVYIGLKEKGLTEPESEARWAVYRADIRVWHGSGIGRVSRPIFASVGKMRLVEFAARNGAEPVRIDCLDFLRPFDALR